MKTIKHLALVFLAGVAFGTIILLVALTLLGVLAVTATYLDEHLTNGAILRAVNWINTVGTKP